MITNYKSGQDLKDSLPLAWSALMKYLDCSPEEEKSYLENIDELVNTLREIGENEESMDYSYIHNTYSSEVIEGFQFVVTGSEYRKDHSICEEEMDLDVTVIDVKAEKEEKKNKKSKQEILNLENWTKFVSESTTEQLLEKLKKIKFPREK